jgi:hypothetical protein
MAERAGDAARPEPAPILAVAGENRHAVPMIGLVAEWVFGRNYLNINVFLQKCPHKELEGGDAVEVLFVRCKTGRDEEQGVGCWALHGFEKGGLLDAPALVC